MAVRIFLLLLKFLAAVEAVSNGCYSFVVFEHGAVLCCAVLGWVQMIRALFEAVWILRDDEIISVSGCDVFTFIPSFNPTKAIFFVRNKPNINVIP